MTTPQMPLQKNDPVQEKCPVPPQLAFWQSRFYSSECLCKQCRVLEEKYPWISTCLPASTLPEKLQFRFRKAPHYCPPCLKPFFKAVESNSDASDRFTKAKKLFTYLSKSIKDFAAAQCNKTYFRLHEFNVECLKLFKEFLPPPTGQPDYLYVETKAYDHDSDPCPYLSAIRRAYNWVQLYLTPDPLKSTKCLKHTIGTAVILHSLLGLLLLGQKTRYSFPLEDLPTKVFSDIIHLLNPNASTTRFAELGQFPSIDNKQEVAFLSAGDDEETAFKIFLKLLLNSDELALRTIEILKAPLNPGAIYFLDRFVLVNPFFHAKTLPKERICDGRSLLKTRNRKKAIEFLLKKNASLPVSLPFQQNEIRIHIFFSRTSWNETTARQQKALAKICMDLGNADVWCENQKIENLPRILAVPLSNKHNACSANLASSIPSFAPLAGSKGELGVRENILNDAHFILQGPAITSEMSCDFEKIAARVNRRTPADYAKDIPDTFKIKRIVQVMQECLGLPTNVSLTLPEVLMHPLDTKKKNGKKSPKQWYMSVLSKNTFEQPSEKVFSRLAHNTSRYVAVAFATYKFLTEKEFTITSGDIRECSRLLYRKLRDNFSKRKTKPDAKFHRKQKFDDTYDLLKAVVIDGPIFPLPKKQKRRKTDESEK